MDLQAETERPVSLVYPVYLVLTASQELQGLREKREILELWVFQEQLDQREIEVCLVYLDVLESMDWLDFLDQWDQWGLLDLPDLLDPAMELDLTTWKVLVEDL